MSSIIPLSLGICLFLLEHSTSAILDERETNHLRAKSLFNNVKKEEKQCSAAGNSETKSAENNGRIYMDVPKYVPKFKKISKTFQRKFRKKNPKGLVCKTSRDFKIILLSKLQWKVTASKSYQEVTAKKLLYSFGGNSSFADSNKTTKPSVTIQNLYHLNLKNHLSSFCGRSTGNLPK